MADTNTPLTFDLDDNLLTKVKKLQISAKARTLSQVIRYAVQEYNFAKFVVNKIPHKQISVRLPLEIKDELNKFSDRKGVSVGELLRVALEDLCSRKTEPQIMKAMATKTTKKTTATKKKPAAKKVTVKKVATKKPAVKKTTATKKPAAKKTVARKPAAKKAAK